MDGLKHAERGWVGNCGEVVVVGDRSVRGGEEVEVLVMVVMAVGSRSW